MVDGQRCGDLRPHRAGRTCRIGDLSRGWPGVRRERLASARRCRPRRRACAHGAPRAPARPSGAWSSSTATGCGLIARPCPAVEDAIARGSPILSSQVNATAQPNQSLITVTHVIYGLHAVSLITGIVTAASVVFAFLTGWPSIIAVILNYVKRSEARGTWLESHFRWQIRTFWWGLLWVALCLVFVVATLGVGLLVAWLPLMVVGLWFIYRVAKGWLRLVDRRPMYE